MAYLRLSSFHSILEIVLPIYKPQSRANYANSDALRRSALSRSLVASRDHNFPAAGKPAAKEQLIKMGRATHPVDQSRDKSLAPKGRSKAPRRGLESEPQTELDKARQVVLRTDHAKAAVR